MISGIIKTLLAQHQVSLVVNEVSYNDWFEGDACSDIWLNSANFTLPLDYSVFAHLYEIPLIQKSLGDNWEETASHWHAGDLSIADWAKQRVTQLDIFPIIHHWLILQGQRSMRDLRMNTLGWFDFKSAWFAPPES